MFMPVCEADIRLCIDGVARSALHRSTPPGLCPGTAPLRTALLRSALLRGGFCPGGAVQVSKQTKVEWGWVSKQSTRNQPRIQNKTFQILKNPFDFFYTELFKNREFICFFSIFKIETKIKTLFFNCEKF
jgi:hypothetical protein